MDFWLNIHKKSGYISCKWRKRQKNNRPSLQTKRLFLT